jgi:hypothetical protein
MEPHSSLGIERGERFLVPLGAIVVREWRTTTSTYPMTSTRRESGHGDGLTSCLVKRLDDDLCLFGECYTVLY